MIFKIELAIAIILVSITLVLLIKVVGEEVADDIYEYKRRNHWRKRLKKRRKRK